MIINAEIYYGLLLTAYKSRSKGISVVPVFLGLGLRSRDRRPWKFVASFAAPGISSGCSWFVIVVSAAPSASLRPLAVLVFSISLVFGVIQGQT
jgi:hypothetical protein